MDYRQALHPHLGPGEPGLIGFGVSTVMRDAGFEQFDAVAGGETAGIAFAAWFAERMMLPTLYVRGEPKGFGRGAQIEGQLNEGQRVLLVEDRASDGCRKVNFCKALRAAGGKVEHVLVRGALISTSRRINRAAGQTMR